MISKVQKWLFVAIAGVFLAGCAAENPPVISEVPIKKPVNENVAGGKIALSAKNFGGKIAIDAAKITEKNGTFEVPVFLENVAAKDALDTIMLKMDLPENIALNRILTPVGFSTEIEGIATKNPVIYFHGNLENEKYRAVTSTKNPMVTLVFSGKRSDKIAFRGAFFFQNAILRETQRAILHLKK